MTQVGTRSTQHVPEDPFAGNGPPEKTPALRLHWPEYLMEAGELCLFMISAGLFATLVEYPGSPVRQAVSDPLLRRALMGAAMGLTAAALIYSPWGQQSGAHMNPALTVAFWRIGKVESPDALWYVLFQFAGGLAGVGLTAVVLGDSFAEPPVSYVVTVPGAAGVAVAFLAETAIAFGLMLLVLYSTNSERFARYTGLFAGLLLAVYITLESPFSGTGLNPARTFASALPSGIWTAGWVYFLAPVLGMLLAGEAFRWSRHRGKARCAKLNHHTKRRCIFRCGYRESPLTTEAPFANSGIPKGGVDVS
ncbi:MAG: aquaporin [Deltaproteobacteria bacterium]